MLPKLKLRSAKMEVLINRKTLMLRRCHLPKMLCMNAWQTWTTLLNIKKFVRRRNLMQWLLETTNFKLVNTKLAYFWRSRRTPARWCNLRNWTSLPVISWLISVKWLINASLIKITNVNLAITSCTTWHLEAYLVFNLCKSLLILYR